MFLNFPNLITIRSERPSASVPQYSDSVFVLVENWKSRRKTRDRQSERRAYISERNDLLFSNLRFFLSFLAAHGK